MTSNAQSGKPVLLLIHGCWHRPEHWDVLAEALKREGYEIVTPALVTSGQSSVVRERTRQDDVAVVRSAVAPHLDNGREVVVVAHSYGGLVATDAVPGMTVEERRERGLRGGVKAWLNIAALIIPKDTAVSDRTPAPDWFSRKDGNIETNEGAENAFYNDVDKAVAREAFSMTHPAAALACLGPTQHVAGDTRARLGYVFCEKDLAVLPAAQRVGIDILGPKVEVFRLDSGHTPWLVPQYVPKLVEIIRDFADN